MEEIEDFKEFLGPISRDYTDAQLRQLRFEMQAMAELLLDIHLHKIAVRKRRRALTDRESEATIPL